MVYNFTNEYSRIVCELEEYMEQLVLAPESRLTIAKKGIEKSRSTLVELKRLVIKNGFPDSKSEIHFFKEIKPAVQSYLLFYQAVFDVESLRPKYHSKRLKKYMQRKLEEIQIFMQQESRCVQYYNCCFTYLDELYFIRDREDIPIELRGNNYLEDEQFNTWQDHTFSVLMANDLLVEYLTAEIERLDSSSQTSPQFGFPATKLTWQGSKTELMEQLYSWDSDNTFGDVPLTQLSDYIQNVFNIRLDKNLSRAFSDMKIRNIPTPFLDKLKDALLKRMGRKK